MALEDSNLRVRWVLAHYYLLIVSTGGQVTNEERETGCRLIQTEKSLLRTGRNSYDVRLWPSHRIPYQLGSNLRQFDKEMFYGALEDFHNHTCLRFEPRRSGETAYIDVFMNMGEWDLCGAAHLCYQGGRQEVEIYHGCSSPHKFIHEIGHAICLQHEQERMDRDAYLDLSQCKTPSSIAPKIDCLTTRGHLYDYNSQLHYWCNPCVGIPTMEGVSKCGVHVNTAGLSVLDADKINTYYNCGGCHRHRWYRVETLTAHEKSHLVNFAPNGKEQLHLCRGYVNGDVATGMYFESERVCQISYDSRVYTLSSYFQLFAIPNGPYFLTDSSTRGYGLYHPLDHAQAHQFVRVGRMVDNTVLFAAVAKVKEADGTVSTLLGMVIKGFQQMAGFPKDGKEFTMEVEDQDGYYHIIGCTE